MPVAGSIPNVVIQRFPYPPYIEDIIGFILEFAFPFLFLIAFLYNCINNIKYITIEKELQLKETMKIMGLPSYMHWIAWYDTSTSTVYLFQKKKVDKRIEFQSDVQVHQVHAISSGHHFHSHNYVQNSTDQRTGRIYQLELVYCLDIFPAVLHGRSDLQLYVFHVLQQGKHG